MPWLGKLFSCPYCLSHWIIILVMITYSPILVVSKLPWVDWIISGFCLVGITSIQIGIVLNLIPFKPDLTDDEVSLVKKMSDALRTAKGLIQQKEEEIDALKKKLEG